MSEFLKPSCPYCKGSGLVQHDQPAQISDEGWFRFVGFGHCPLCRGFSREDRQLCRMELTRAGGAAALFMMRTKADRAIVGCPQAGCRQWADITEFLTPRRRAGDPPVAAACAAGHPLTLEIVN
jgi:hypothetical protein